VKFVPVIMVAVMALAAATTTASAQAVGSLSGGNATYTLPTSGSDDAGTTVIASPWTSFRYSSFFAAIHGWMGGSSVSTPVRIGLPSARAVRFASAGRPDARVTRVTCP